MKQNLKYILGLLVTLSFVMACSDDFLNTENPNQPSETTFWTSENDALMGLTACYDGMQDGDLYNDNIDGWKFGFLARETSTDNGDHSWGDWMLGSTIPKCASSTTDECFQKYWKANFEVIKRANILLKNIDRCGMSEEKASAMKAEAIAIRALMYCNLTSVFRDVPYLTEPLTLAQAQAPKTPKAEIAEAIIKDLKDNVSKLPSKGSESAGRMCREAGYAILGRIALFNQKWDEAISAYDQVIGKVSLFKSGDGSDPAKNFADLFTEANENAPEVLLSIHYKGPGLSEGQTFGVCWQAPMNAIEASLNLAEDFYCTDGKPWNKSSVYEGPSSYLAASEDWKHWENRDPRFYGTLWVTGMLWNGSAPSWNPARSSVAIRKWYTPEEVANEHDASLDYYVIRYAEVLLSMAEAKMEKGAPQSEVTKYINEVRARVNMPSVESVEGAALSKEELRAVVRHERRVELAFEDLRFADLYRWGEFKNSLQRIKDDEASMGRTYAIPRGSVRGPQDELWPIPQSEIDTNPMLKQHDEWK